MKTKAFFLCMAICAMTTGLTSCAPDFSADSPISPDQLDGVMINLAELGQEIRNCNLEEIKQTIQNKGFIQFNETREERDLYTKGHTYYASGIYLDSNMSESQIKNAIRNLQHNATILWVDYHWHQGEFYLSGLECIYVLAREATDTYKFISHDLHQFYTNTYPFIMLEDSHNPTALAQTYNWIGQVAGKQYYNIDDELAFLLSNNAITESQYQLEISKIGGDKPYNRAAFENRLSTAHHEIIELFSGEAKDFGNNSRVWLTTSENNALDITDVVIVEGLWRMNWVVLAN